MELGAGLFPDWGEYLQNGDGRQVHNTKSQYKAQSTKLLLAIFSKYFLLSKKISL